MCSSLQSRRIHLNQNLYPLPRPAKKLLFFSPPPSTHPHERLKRCVIILVFSKNVLELIKQKNTMFFTWSVPRLTLQQYHACMKPIIITGCSQTNVTTLLCMSEPKGFTAYLAEVAQTAEWWDLLGFSVPAQVHFKQSWGRQRRATEGTCVAFPPCHSPHPPLPDACVERCLVARLSTHLRFYTYLYQVFASHTDTATPQRIVVYEVEILEMC